jgi:signal peptidase II
MLKWGWISVLVLVLDQASKWLASGALAVGESIPLVPMVALARAHNYGAAFSFLDNASGWQRWFFVLLALVVCGFLLVWLMRLARHEIRAALGISLILGGAVGNLVDRVRLGYVIDFIDVYYRSWHFPTFNLADSAITLGAGLLILDALLGQRPAGGGQ